MKTKKSLLIVAVLLLAAITVQVFALAAVQAVSCVPSLSFTGTTANVGVSASGNPTDSLSVYVTLKRGNVLIDGWSDTGTGTIDFSATAAVVKGQTYTVTATLTVNGVRQNPVSVSGTC